MQEVWLENCNDPLCQIIWSVKWTLDSPPVSPGNEVSSELACVPAGSLVSEHVTFSNRHVSAPQKKNQNTDRVDSYRMQQQRVRSEVQ